MLNLKRPIFKFLLFFSCPLLAGATLFYHYFINVDLECTAQNSGAGHACYTVDFLSIVPIASADITVSATVQDGIKIMCMTLTSIGVAKTLAGRIRFELASSFNTIDHLPRTFDIALHDKNGLRYLKTSVYDFNNSVLLWKKHYAPARNKKDDEKLFELSWKAYSPLSALYHILASPSNAALKGIVKVQTEKTLFVVQKKAETKVDGQPYGTGADKVTIFTYVISKDAEFVEPWRRRKELTLDLFFSGTAGEFDKQGYFPIRMALPFNLVTMKRVAKTS